MKTRPAMEWVRAALRHAERTLTWLHADETRWDDPVSNHPAVSLLEKIHSEVALLGLMCLRLPERHRDASIMDRLVVLAAQTESPELRYRWLSRIMRLPQLAPAFALPVLFRERLMRPDPSDGALLRKALCSPLVNGVERYPFRRLDIDWLKGMVGIRPGRLDPQTLRASCLAAPTHPIYASLTDLYALTHAWLYDTDFGQRRPARTYGVASVTRSLRAAAAFALAEGDPDLLGEVVACAWASPRVPAWAHSMGNLVLELWNRFGAVPPPDLEVSLLTVGSRAERDAYFVRSTYHPTLVGGLMVALSLRDGGVAAVSRGDFRPSDAAGAWVEQAALQIQPTTPIARQMLDAMCSHQLASTGLAALLNDAALIQAARRYDLDRVLHLLEARVAKPTARHLGTRDVTHEALAFFRAQDVGDGVYGAHFLSPVNQRHPAAGELQARTRQRLQRVDENWRRAEDGRAE